LVVLLPLVVVAQMLVGGLNRLKDAGRVAREARDGSGRTERGRLHDTGGVVLLAEFVQVGVVHLRLEGDTAGRAGVEAVALGRDRDQRVLAQLGVRRRVVAVLPGALASADERDGDLDVTGRERDAERGGDF